MRKKGGIVNAALRSAVCAIALVALVAAALDAADRPDLAGAYRSERITPEGLTSRGLVRIVAHGESYLVSWMLSPPVDEWVEWDPDLIGVGLVRGEMLAVSYFGEDMAGVMVYRITKDGRLVGEWVGAGSEGRVGRETLTRMAVRSD